MYVGGARFYCLIRTLWIAVVIGFLVFKRGATTSIVLCPSIASFSSVSLSIGDTPSLPRRPPGLRRRRPLRRSKLFLRAAQRQRPYFVLQQPPDPLMCAAHAPLPPALPSRLRGDPSREEGEKMVN